MVQTLKTLTVIWATLLAVVLLGAGTGVIRWDQINPLFRNGTDTYGQSSDGTHTSGNIPTYDSNGGLTSFYGVQGTDTKLMTAGTVTSSAGLACTDSNGGLTTVGCTTTGITLQTNSSNNTSQTLLNLESAGSVVVANPSGGVVTITGPTFQFNGTNNATQTALNLVAGNGMQLTNSGSGVSIIGPQFQIGGSSNTSQTVLNFTAGNAMTLTNPGGGVVNIAGPQFQVGGSNNTTQTLLNFTASNGIVLTNPSGGVVNIAAPNPVHTIGMAWGQSGGSALTTGTTSVPVPFGCTLGSTWYAYSDQTITFDVLVNGSSITASAPPTAAAGQNNGSTSTWSTSISAGNLIGWKIASVSGSPTVASVTINCQ